MSVEVKFGDVYPITETADMDLTTATGVRLLCRPHGEPRSGDPLLLASSISDAPNGVVTHVLTGTLAVGSYDVELEVTIPGGKITFPAEGYELLIVTPDLG